MILDLFPDGMLRVPSLHDSYLIAMAQRADGTLDMVFREPCGTHIRLTFHSDAHPTPWAEGICLPVIVSVVWLCQSAPDLPWLEKRFELDSAARADKAFRAYHRGGGWMLAIDANYGDDVIVMGTGPLTPETIKAVRVDGGFLEFGNPRPE